MTVVEWRGKDKTKKGGKIEWRSDVVGVRVSACEKMESSHWGEWYGRVENLEM